MRKIAIFIFLLFFSTSFLLSSKKEISVKEIRRAILLMKADWNAEETPIFHRMKENKMFLGARVDENFYDFDVKRYDSDLESLALPSRYDLRNVDGKNWMTPVRDQGRCGSCVAFAVMGIFEGQLKITNGFSLYDFDLSEQKLFSCGNGKCESGMWIEGAISHLRKYGTTDEACAPYLSGNIGNDYSCGGYCEDLEKRTIKLLSSSEVTSWESDNIQSVKKALMRGPVLTRMSVYEDFTAYKSGVYKHVTGDFIGGHAVVIVGYENENKAWIVKNSWGKDWGEEGYFRIVWNDASGVGSSTFKFDVPKFDGYVRIPEFSEKIALSGNVNLSCENTFKDMKRAQLKFYKEKTTTLVYSAESLDEPFSFSFNSNDIADGIYDANVEVSNDTVTKRGETKRVYVFNHEQNLKLKLVSPESGLTVSDKVKFRFVCENVDVPLLSMDFKILGEEIDKTITIREPCPIAEVSWRTNKYKDGEYKIFAIGRIGSLANYESNHVMLHVKNE